MVHVYGEAHRFDKIKLGKGHFVLKVNPGVLIMVNDKDRREIATNYVSETAQYQLFS